MLPRRAGDSDRASLKVNGGRCRSEAIVMTRVTSRMAVWFILFGRGLKRIADWTVPESVPFAVSGEVGRYPSVVFCRTCRLRLVAAAAEDAGDTTDISYGGERTVPAVKVPPAATVTSAFAVSRCRGGNILQGALSPVRGQIQTGRVGDAMVTVASVCESHVIPPPGENPANHVVVALQFPPAAVEVMVGCRGRGLDFLPRPCFGPPSETA